MALECEGGSALGDRRWGPWCRGTHAHLLARVRRQTDTYSRTHIAFVAADTGSSCVDVLLRGRAHSRCASSLSVLPTRVARYRTLPYAVAHTLLGLRAVFCCHATCCSAFRVCVMLCDVWMCGR